MRAWRARFMDQLAAVRGMGFDDRFLRMWEFYLAVSEAGFATGKGADVVRPHIADTTDQQARITGRALDHGE